MDLTRVSTVPLPRLASGSQRRNTWPFWKPQTDAESRLTGLVSPAGAAWRDIAGGAPPSRRPQRRAHFPERHRLVPGGASAPSAHTAVGTGAGGPHAQARRAARRWIGRQRSLLPPSLSPPSAPPPPSRRRRGAGPGPARVDPAQDLVRPRGPGGEGARSPESEDKEEGPDSPLPRNRSTGRGSRAGALRTGCSRPAAVPRARTPPCHRLSASNKVT